MRPPPGPANPTVLGVQAAAVADRTGTVPVPIGNAICHVHRGAKDARTSKNSPKSFSHADPTHAGLPPSSASLCRAVPPSGYNYHDNYGAMRGRYPRWLWSVDCPFLNNLVRYDSDRTHVVSNRPQGTGGTARSLRLGAPVGNRRLAGPGRGTPRERSGRGGWVRAGVKRLKSFVLFRFAA